MMRASQTPQKAHMPPHPRRANRWFLSGLMLVCLGYIAFVAGCQLWQYQCLQANDCPASQTCNQGVCQASGGEKQRSEVAPAEVNIPDANEPDDANVEYIAPEQGAEHTPELAHETAPEMPPESKPEQPNDASPRPCEALPLYTKPCNVNNKACKMAGIWVCTVDGLSLRCNSTPDPNQTKPESCNGLDDDCDGLSDNIPSRPCYTGSAATKGVGLCKAGVEHCRAGKWTECVGENLPQLEVCGDQQDNNCDGQTDEVGCHSPCLPNTPLAQIQPAQAATVSSVKWSPDSKLIAVATSSTKEVTIYEIKNGTPMVHVTIKDTAEGAFDPTGAFYASYSVGNKVHNQIRIYDIGNKSYGKTFGGTLSTDPNMTACGPASDPGGQGTCQAPYECDDSECVQNDVGGHIKSINQIAYHPKGTFLVTLASGQLVVWSVATQTVVKRLGRSHYLSGINRFAFSADGQYLVVQRNQYSSGNYDTSLEVYEFPGLQQVGQVSDASSAAGPAAMPFAMHPLNNVLARTYMDCQGSTTQSNCILNLERLTIPALAPQVLLTYTGKWPEVLSNLGPPTISSQNVIAYRHKGKQEVSTRPNQPLPYTGYHRFSPNGDVFAVIVGQEIKYINVFNGQESAPLLLKHTEAAIGFNFQPGGQQLAAWFADGLVKIWRCP